MKENKIDLTDYMWFIFVIIGLFLGLFLGLINFKWQIELLIFFLSGLICQFLWLSILDRVRNKQKQSEGARE